MYPTDVETKNPTSKHYGHWLKSLNQKMADTLEEAKSQMGKYYDQGKQSASKLNPEDWVVLNDKNICTKRLTKKLAPKHSGPFKILDKISS